MKYLRRPENLRMFVFNYLMEELNADRREQPKIHLDCVENDKCYDVNRLRCKIDARCLQCLKSMKLHHYANEIYPASRKTNYFEASRTATQLEQSEYALYDLPTKPCIVSLHAYEGVNIVFERTSSITRHFVAAQSDILKPANI